MKPLIKILLVGSLVFVAAGIALDWRNFFRLEQPGSRDDPEARAAADDTVRSFISMARHAYRSGGDPRFVERLPASDDVKAELVAELGYLARNGRVQVSELTRLETLGVDLLSPTRATVRTREDWVAHIESASNGSRLSAPRMHVVFAEYRLAHYGGGWQIIDWNHVPPPPPPDPDDPRDE